MFRTYNVFDSVWQMNLFVALQVSRNLSGLNYLTSARTGESEPEAEEAPNREAIPARPAEMRAA
jgi:hypothetical protein